MRVDNFVWDFCRLCASLQVYKFFPRETRVFKTRFLFCRNQVFKTRDLCGILILVSSCSAVVKRVSKTRFLNRSRVSKTRNAILLNHLKL